MTKHEVEVQELLLRHQANGCISALSKWEMSVNHDTARFAIPAIRAEIAVLEARANGLAALLEQWDEFGQYFEETPE